MEHCEVCSAKVREVRRGRCWGCYSKWVESRPVGLGAACCMCGERRREFLRSIELLANWMPVCHTCAYRAARISPMPQTVAEIRRVLLRERRDRDRRRGSADSRVYAQNRRTGERRGPREDGMETPVDDEMIMSIFDLAAEIEASSADDLTRIVETPY